MHPFNKKVYFSVIFIGIFAIVTIQAEICKSKFPDAHYQEFGCKPELDKNGCPKRYDCDEALRMLTDPKKCYFHGKLYSIGEKVDGKLTEPNCIAAAVCMKDTGRQFIYAHIDCPEFFGHPKLEKDCYRKYELEKCCSSGTVCPPFPKDLASCKVGDKTYREGEKFFPEDDCLSCVCQKGYSGKNEAPFCKPIKCGLGLVNSNKFKKGDIPVYLEKRLCCPIRWIQYDEEKFEKFGKKLEGTADPSSCTFGSKVFANGEKFQPQKKEKNIPEVNCACQLPPMLTCYQKP